MITASVKLKGLNPQKLIEAFDKTAFETLQIATVEAKKVLKVVTGTQYASLAQLKLMHHPYGFRSSVAPPMPPGYINRQSGNFYRSFIWEQPRKRSGKMIVELQGDTEREALLIPGTSKMMPRPFDTLFNVLMRDLVMNRMRNEFRKVLRVNLRTQFK